MAKSPVPWSLPQLKPQATVGTHSTYTLRCNLLIPPPPISVAEYTLHACVEPGCRAAAAASHWPGARTHAARGVPGCLPGFAFKLMLTFRARLLLRLLLIALLRSHAIFSLVSLPANRELLHEHNFPAAAPPPTVTNMRGCARVFRSIGCSSCPPFPPGP